MSEEGCPRPEKRRYGDRGQARLAARALNAKSSSAIALVEYRCRCGSWHIGRDRTALPHCEWCGKGFHSASREQKCCTRTHARKARYRRARRRRAEVLVATWERVACVPLPRTLCVDR